MPKRLPEYAVRNREVWTVSNANYTAASATEGVERQLHGRQRDRVMGAGRDHLGQMAHARV